ncbi:hypothetical protein COCSADRAFT_31267 [Bipolaris sorokiniana ND90Pr]|uniref:Secreted protein n=1 Tax=Cochliobolus sativus (strain ND90Pr / ATCC 201652) TaxID=665912 RepID=M2QTN8_COCSN|nr:uncharacterized protein COCSADRAFT_31267 [Bipolaris sorokiniana ND90Pr]EMD58534.1 hypothetical protein COCSADRAFT_31267 [Bipolaris sorokiniana ND90Pr]
MAMWWWGWLCPSLRASRAEPDQPTDSEKDASDLVFFDTLTRCMKRSRWIETITRVLDCTQCFPANAARKHDITWLHVDMAVADPNKTPLETPAWTTCVDFWPSRRACPNNALAHTSSGFPEKREMFVLVV